MSKSGKFECRIVGCAEGVPASLAKPSLCMDHFLDEAMQLLEDAAASCKDGNVVKEAALERLCLQADLAVQSLTSGSKEVDTRRKEQLLQFLLGLANLQEYLSHHVSLVGRAR